VVIFTLDWAVLILAEISSLSLYMLAAFGIMDTAIINKTILYDYLFNKEPINIEFHRDEQVKNI
jgi:hypothetical protein